MTTNRPQGKGNCMATAAEIKAKQAEFHEALDNLESANRAYEEAKGPYLSAKDAVIFAITKVDGIDNELETLQAEYEPQTPPGPA